MATKIQKAVLTEAAKARIAICKDVLKHIPVMKVKRGTYCRAFGERNQTLINNTSPNSEAQEYLPVLEKHCNVCALGGMMLSYIRKYDNFGMGVFHRHDFGLERVHITNQLEKFFNSQQLDLIESAFEVPGTASARKSYALNIKLEEESVHKDEDWILKQKARLFGAQHVTPRKRLRAIMLNVIKNKGTFKP